MAPHNKLGNIGETIAVEYLKNKGYKVLSQNWRYKKYEIDIIADNDEFLIFVEVKTRTSDVWGNPEDAVSESKIRKIVEAADYYAKENNICKPIRFDVIAVLQKGKTYEVRHFDDAFFAPLN